MPRPVLLLTLLLCATLDLAALAASEVPAPAASVPSATAALEARIASLETQRTWLVALLTGSAFAVPLGVWRLWTLLIQRAHELLEGKLESRWQVLSRLIDDRDAEERFRREVPITVVATRTETFGLLRDLGFRQVRHLDPEHAITGPLAAADVVVLDLEPGFSDELAQQILNRHGLDFALLYTKGTKQYGARFGNYANSPVTLYNRLFEMLRFRAAWQARNEGK